jgi:hypothetical protein
VSYLALVIITLVIGFRTVFVATPLQPYFIAVMSTYTGVAVEGLVIDTDHWRHYYLLLGLVWGFSIATMNYQRRLAAAAPARPRSRHRPPTGPREARPDDRLRRAIQQT